MGLEDAFQIQFGALIVQKTIIPFEIVPMAGGGLGIGSLRLGGLLADNLDQPLGQSLISQFTIGKFVLRPARTLQATLHAQRIHRGWFDPDSEPEPAGWKACATAGPLS